MLVYHQRKKNQKRYNKHLILFRLVITMYYHCKISDNYHCWSFDYLQTGIMVSMLTLSVVNRGFQPWLGQAKDYTIGICCFSSKYAALRRKSIDWLALNRDNISEWGDMCIHGLLFQWASTIKIQLSVLV